MRSPEQPWSNRTLYGENIGTQTHMGRTRHPHAQDRGLQRNWSHHAQFWDVQPPALGGTDVRCSSCTGKPPRPTFPTSTTFQEMWPLSTPALKDRLLTCLPKPPPSALPGAPTPQPLSSWGLSWSPSSRGLHGVLP